MAWRVQSAGSRARGAAITCTAFTSKSPGCATCLTAWTRTAERYPNTSACFLAVDPTATACANNDACDDDCTSQLCGNCADQATFGKCLTDTTATGGGCFTIANETARIPGLCGVVKGSIHPNFVGIEAGLSATGYLFEALAARSGKSVAELSNGMESFRAGQTGNYASG